MFVLEIIDEDFEKNEKILNLFLVFFRKSPATRHVKYKIVYFLYNEFLISPISMPHFKLEQVLRSVISPLAR